MTPFYSAPAFFLSLLLLSLSFLYCHICLPNIPQDGIPFDGKVSIVSIKKVPSRFGERFLVKGKNNHLPISFYMQKKDHRLLKHSSEIFVKGILTQKNKANYWITPDKDNPYRIEDKQFSWSWFRYKIKESLQKEIVKLYEDENCSSLLSALLLGTAPKSKITQEFARFGLQHLLAISGFHFALLSFFICLILNLVFPYRFIPWIAIFLMSLYSLLIDLGPSVIRAWITFLSMQGTSIFERESSGLNRLGVALIVTLLFDPTFCILPGFQFSFLVTFAILLAFPLIDNFLKTLFTPIHTSNLKKTSLLDKHALIILIFFRKLIALSISVQLVSLPLALYWFHTFPLLSLLYNLFFPLMIGWSLLLFISAIILFPIGGFIHHLNELLLKGLFNTLSLPTHRDIFIDIDSISTWSITLYITLFIILALYFQKNRNSSPSFFEFY